MTGRNDKVLKTRNSYDDGTIPLKIDEKRNLVATEGSNSMKGMRGIKDTEIKGANLQS